MSARSIHLACLAAIPITGLFAFLVADETRHMSTRDRWFQHDIRRPKAPVVAPVYSLVPTPAPKDAVSLFDGSNLDAWKSADGGPGRWKVTHEYMEVAPGTGAIETVAKFGDVQLHLE